MSIDVFGICNAIYDIQVRVSREALADLGLTPGAMHLMDESTYTTLLQAVEANVVNKAAGGSGANTMMGVAALGGRSAFASRVGCDAYGDEYLASLRSSGVFPAIRSGRGRTGACLVLLTPDGERTMCTFLGEGQNFSSEDLAVDVLSQSTFVYVTGYMWGTESQRGAVERALAEARRGGTTVAFSLADRFCILANRAEFWQLIQKDVRVIFGNADEAMLLCESEQVDEAASRLGSKGRMAFVTLGSEGALVAQEGKVEHVAAEAVDAIDTTGAGDAFAAGVLYGLTHGKRPIEAAVLGCQLAAHVVSRLGPRPDPDAARALHERAP